MMKEVAKPSSRKAKEMSHRGRESIGIITLVGPDVKGNLKKFHFGRFIAERIASIKAGS